MNSAKKYSVILVCPTGYIHSLALLEIAETIHYSLINLGIDSILTDSLDVTDRRQIILGAHLIKHNDIEWLKDDAIIYNFEQIDPNSPWLDQTYFSLLNKYKVWDYSLQNIQILKDMGVTNIHHLPLGYVYQMSRINSSDQKDIDILFYGSINQRRENIILSLKEHGINIINLFGVYGQERDSFIARSKIVINIHFYESKIFEIARVSYLLANNVCVVSEEGPDPIEKMYSDAVVFSAYDQLVPTCLSLLNNEEKRIEISNNGRKIIESFNQMNYLAPLLSSYE
jgi:hypothetical protein